MPKYNIPDMFKFKERWKDEPSIFHSVPTEEEEEAWREIERKQEERRERERTE